VTSAVGNHPELSWAVDVAFLPRGYLPDVLQWQVVAVLTIVVIGVFPGNQTTGSIVGLATEYQS
jgi:hypothetical protein